MWTLSDEGRNMLEETTEEVKLPMDMQSKNSMVDVARNKAAIDYCAYPAVFHIRVCLWWDSRACPARAWESTIAVVPWKYLTNDHTASLTVTNQVTER